jgi:hypothetical protein
VSNAEDFTLWDERRCRLLEMLCDTFVPAVEGAGAASSDDGPTAAAFMGRSAGDLGVASVLAHVMATALRQEDQEAIAGFVDALLAEGFDEADVVARTARLHELWDLGGPVKQAVRLLRVLTMLVFYGLPTEEDGSNPN